MLKTIWVNHKLSQLLLLWNSLFKGVWKNHCISIWSTRSIFSLHQSKPTFTWRCICWWCFITYGHPRNHIWTFTAARTSIDNQRRHCPCSGFNTQIDVPPFINENYFCEIGTSASGNPGFVESNPLWDGQGCTGSSTCCEFNNPPWFCQQLPQPITEDIEIRLLLHVFGGFPELTLIGNGRRPLIVNVTVRKSGSQDQKNGRHW